MSTEELLKAKLLEYADGMNASHHDASLPWPEPLTIDEAKQYAKSIKLNLDEILHMDFDERWMRHKLTKRLVKKIKYNK